MKIVILTGAGISVPSGIPDFRSSITGLWENHKIEEVATREALRKTPQLVYDFYQWRYDQYSSVKPNKAHLALTELETKHDVTIITQNVDSLHEMAGSSNVIHMHGDLKHVRDINSQEDNYDLILRDSVVDKSLYRPNVVLFGEFVIGEEVIMPALWESEMFISIGTSNNVYPAANFHNMVNRKSCSIYQLNKEETVGSNHFDHVILGDVEEIVPRFVNSIL